MAYGMFTEDFAAICIVLAEGDLKLQVAEVIRRCESEQKRLGMYFGVGPEDFRSAFRMLAFRSDLDDWSAERLEDAFRGSLEQWLGRVLSYRDIYFNDEGEHWGTDQEPGSSAADYRPLVLSWLDTVRHAEPSGIIQALEELGWSSATLPRFMERGWEHDDFSTALANTLSSQLGLALVRARDSAG